VVLQLNHGENSFIEKEAGMELDAKKQRLNIALSLAMDLG
jgi:hypothetical protein